MEDEARAACAAEPSQALSVAGHSIPFARVLRTPKQEAVEKTVPASTMAVEVFGMRLVAEGIRSRDACDGTRRGRGTEDRAGYPVIPHSVEIFVGLEPIDLR